MSSVVPEGWEFNKIGSCLQAFGKKSIENNEYEVFTSSSKGLMKQSDYYGENRLTRRENVGFNIIPNLYITYRSRSDTNKFFFNQNNLGMTGLVSKYYPVFSSINGIEYNSFLVSLFEYHSQEFANEGVGTSQVVLSFPALRNVKLPIPPLPEQKKIASILTSVDEVIENTQKQIDKLQDLKKATMNELLTKGIGHIEFKDSELGRIPKSWDIVRFDEISSQKTLGTTERGGLVDKIPLIKMGDLQFGNVIVGANETISKSKLTSDNFLSRGDFLFNTRNTPELVGKVGNYNSSKLAAYDNNLLKIDFSEDISSLFMGIQFNELNVKRRLRRIVAGTTSVAAIYWNDLKKFYVLKPSMTEQKNIYAVFESIDNQVKTLECKLTQTQSLKKSLMQDLLTGKVRVTVN